MQSLKKFSNKLLSKNYICIFMMIFLMNNLKVFGTENKSYSFSNNKKDVDLDEIYKLKSIPYHKYDGLDGQLKTFFGCISHKFIIFDKIIKRSI